MDVNEVDKKPIWNTVGLAGEFFVLAELLKRGYQASFTLENAKTVDIFSSHAGRTVKIQVKTNSGKPRTDAKWLVGVKVFDLSEESVKDLIYVFVLLNPVGTDQPRYYIAKAWDVIRQTKDRFENLLRETGEGKRPYKGKLTPQARRNYPMKSFYSAKFEEDGYRFLSWDEIFA